MFNKNPIQLFNEEKGNLFINQSCEIVKLIGVAETEDDFYYITLDKKNNLIFNNGHLISLKKELDEKSYSFLIKNVKLNNAIYKEFFGNNIYYQQFRNEIINQIKSHKSINPLTEIYFDIYL